MTSRSLLFLGFLAMIATVAFLIYMQISYSEASEARPQAIGKCYNRCVTDGIKRIQKTTSGCVSKVNGKQKINAQCMKRLLSAIHDSCNSYCKDKVRGVMW